LKGEKWYDKYEVIIKNKNNPHFLFHDTDEPRLTEFIDQRCKDIWISLHEEELSS